MSKIISKIYIKEIKIKKFRGLHDITLPIGERITLISGKNATSKSTILGIIAHTFNFERNYTQNQDIQNRTIWGTRFSSKFSEHFKLSEKFDHPHTIDLSGSILNSESQKEIIFSQELGDYSKQERQRVVVRYRDDTNTKYDRKITHPVIYLGLKRFFPIVERQNEQTVFEYFLNDENRKEFIDLSNKILLKTHNSSSKLTSTKSKFITSSVAHGDNYDESSVSVGEDNIGQIILALLSFKKLANEIGDQYKGGILLIDEVENSLFPAAQKKLLTVLNEFASNYHLQIIMTSHSPVFMKEVLELNQDKNKLIYLTNSHGKITSPDWNWEKIEADISGTIILPKEKTTIKKIDCYVEDEEAKLLLETLLRRSKVKKHLRIDFIKGFSCKHYLNLIEKVPHIKNNTLIILDGDLQPDKEKIQKTTIHKTKHPNAIALPTTLPPDQLLFWILHNLPESDPYWNNEMMFTKSIFGDASQEIYSKFSIQPAPLTFDEFEEKIDQYRKVRTERMSGKKVRDIFKDFFKKDAIKIACQLNNPFKYYFEENPALKKEFISNIENALNRFGVSID